MKDHQQFETWLETMIKDAKDKLRLEDSDLAYHFLRLGSELYLKSVCRCESCHKGKNENT